MRRFKQAHEMWRDHLTLALSEKSIYGTEKATIVICFFLQSASLYSLLFRVFRPSEDRARRLLSELYIFVWLAILIAFLVYVREMRLLAVAGAAYYTCELTVNVCAIFFGGKLEFREPTSSIERSLIFFVVDLFQIIISFAIFYAQLSPSWTPLQAFTKSLMLFATVQNPIEGLTNSPLAVSLVTVHVALNFIFFVLFIAAYTGRIAALERVPRRRVSGTQ